MEQSYRFGFHRIWSVLLVSVLVGLATVAGLILLVIPGIYLGVRLVVSIEALVACLCDPGGGLAAYRGRQLGADAALW